MYDNTAPFELDSTYINLKYHGNCHHSVSPPVLVLFSLIRNTSTTINKNNTSTKFPWEGDMSS